MHCTIDFCNDNLRFIPGAKEAAEQIVEQLKDTSVVFYYQNCIKACRPCHKDSLILRLNGELLVGETNQEIIEKTLKKIKEASCLSE